MPPSLHGMPSTTYNFWRPVTAIRAAETDGNHATEPDPGWLPLLVTPPFPDYTSGHSTFSGAAAAVLSLFYGMPNIRFSTTSDGVPRGRRSFRGFLQAAREAALSRMYGGIHFRSQTKMGWWQAWLSERGPLRKQCVGGNSKHAVAAVSPRSMGLLSRVGPARRRRGGDAPLHTGG